MSLRRRLLIGFVAVAAVLVFADVALATTFRSYLVGRVDDQLLRDAGGLADFATRGDRPGPPPRGGGPPRGPAYTDYYVALCAADGTVLTRVDTPLYGEDAGPAPEPAEVQAARAANGRPITIERAEADWRMIAMPSGAGGDDVVLVAASLADVGPTYRRMVAVLAIATVAVLATLAVVAWWVLRQGVRPLAAMTATAGAIAGGALSERVADVTDRTEAGRLGLALNAMLARIERAFAERAASEDRLRRFVADASHELRTPLTSIRGYTELYRAGGLDDPGALRGALRRVEQESERMGSLVDDLLLLAKIDQGRPLETRPVDLAKLAADAAADLRAVQPDRPVTVSAVPVTVVADEARLRQAIGNLLSNARVHTPASTPVSVRVGTDNGWAVLEVADEGPGMSAEAASRAFERFYRADPARSRASGGSGLGLSIVHGVVEAHGGEVAVDTEPGRGARFRVRLPLDGSA